MTEEKAAPEDRIPPATVRPRFPVVAVGASAGGLEAYQELLQALPADSGMAFVLIQHLDPTRESHLSEILTRATTMPVIEVHDEPPIEPNHVYVIPPNRTMLMSDSHLTLLPRPEERGQHRPIDSFFRSLAEDQSHHAIGVVLSGTGNDGTLGLEAIKAEGGITFAQDQSAQQDGMPRSAATAGCVDFVLSPSAIAAELARIARHPYVAPGGELAGVPARAESDLNRILRLLHDATGVDFTLYKSTTLHRRITRRMLLQRLEGLGDYLQYLQANAREVEELYQDILISVTAFFRDPACFETIKSVVLPRLVRERPPTERDPLRIWVLGCSTGEEAYSLAITVAEFAAERGIVFPTQVFASDLNEQGIERARSGIYSKNITQDVSPERLRRFFVEKDGGYRVSKAIRDACVFARQNVLADPPFSRIDIVSCRNLLIYLEPVLQKRLLPLLHYAIRPGGFLWLGSSESVAGFSELFDAAEPKYKIFLRKPGPAAAGMHVVPSVWEPRDLPQLRRRADEGRAADLLREADRAAITRYAPPGVVVNAELDVQQFRGDTSPYLTQSPGKPTLSVLKMAREGLLVPLRAAVDKAAKEGRVVRQEGLRVRSHGGDRTVNLEVLPLAATPEARQGFLILFDDLERSTQSDQARATTEAAPLTPHDETAELARVTQELLATREYMQSLIEQKEAANEEMQSANEEIQSANEELQSVNEELQTSKEEIQSSNEELTTVNDELRHGNDQLDRAHNDLNNLVASSGLTMVMVGTDLRIRRFSSAAEKLLKLIAADIGSSIEQLKFPLDIPDLEERLLEVIDTVTPHEREVQDRQGRWYSLRLRPYKTSDNKIDGAVILLVDIAEQKRSQEQIRFAEEKYRLLVEGATGIAIVLLDPSGVVLSWNVGAERIFGYTEAEIVGQAFTRFFLPEDVARGLPARELEQARTVDVSPDDNWLIRKDGQRFWANGMTTALKDDAGGLRGFSKVVRDNTAQKLAEEALVANERRYRILLQALPAAVYTCDALGKATFFNSAAVALWGREPALDTAYWCGAARLFRPDGAELSPEDSPMAIAVREGRPVRGEEIVIERPDGSRTNVLPYPEPIFDESGNVTGAVNMLMDLSELNRAEAALRESESRLQVALAAAQMGTWLWEFETNRHLLDPSLHRLMGFAPEERVYSHEEFLQPIHPDDRPMVRSAFERSATEHVELDIQFRVVWPDGTVRWLRDRGNVITSRAGGPCLTGACVDITDRVLAEQTLQEADRRKDEFLAVLAHELRNPLAPIKSTLEVLRRTAEPTAVARSIDMIRRQVEKLTRLVDDILDVARLSGGRIELRRERLDLRSIVERAVESVQHDIAAARHELSIVLPSAPVPVEGDAVRLEQIVGNLLNNAVKYTDAGGVITLALEVGATDSDGQHAREAVVSVRDTGIGLTRELLARVFDFFARGDASYARHRGGLGIGLSLVQNLVTMHGGSVSASSEGLGKGSAFVVRLPMRVEAEAQPTEDSKRNPTPVKNEPRAARRVLVVDDNVDAAESEAELLRLKGHEVHVAHSGQAALAVAVHMQPDVVLLDIGMPEMDGYEVAREMRRRAEFNNTALVALSGYGSEDDRRRSKDAGFDAHLLKPADDDAISHLLASLGPRRK